MTTLSPRLPTQRREALVELARSWVGTPYEHRQETKGVAVDCVGLIRQVGFEGGVLEISDKAWAPFARYSRSPNPRRMLRAMELFLVRVEGEPSPGLVAWLQWREDLPMHLAIIGNVGARLTLIHALNDLGRCAEHDFSPIWRARVASLWRFPGA